MRNEGGGGMDITLKTGVEKLPGIGPARAKGLERLNIRTVEDLLEYYPKSHL